MARKKLMSRAMLFILLFGIVSMFSDMTKESAESIRGAFLSLMGASAATIGLVSGLGELVGYSLRFVSGKLADRTRKYWPIVIVGYCLELVTIPAMAFVGENGWVAACILLVVQKFGKAVKKPAKDTVVSFAASREGAGKAFGLQELLDQFGAVLGPLLLYVIMLFKTDGSTFERYSFCFLALAVPAVLTLVLLVVTRLHFPNPEQFEPDAKEYVPLKVGSKFVLYIIGISLFAFGFLDYSLVAMHVNRTCADIVPAAALPLLYSAAMLVDAVAALLFGNLYDRWGMKVLVVSALFAAPFSFLIFLGHSAPALVVGVVMWGIGMGAQESILKAAVTDMTPKSARATGFGVFSLALGLAWFLGSWCLGALYDINLTLMASVSAACQLLAIPFYILSSRE
ncbi:MAG: MFS transporter [Bacteroidales bacterium]|nr:MFS transporter [Bacteroidales bacterium]